MSIKSSSILSYLLSISCFRLEISFYFWWMVYRRCFSLDLCSSISRRRTDCSFLFYVYIPLSFSYHSFWILFFAFSSFSIAAFNWELKFFKLYSSVFTFFWRFLCISCSSLSCYFNSFSSLKRLSSSSSWSDFSFFCRIVWIYLSFSLWFFYS